LKPYFSIQHSTLSIALFRPRWPLVLLRHGTYTLELELLQAPALVFCVLVQFRPHLGRLTGRQRFLMIKYVVDESTTSTDAPLVIVLNFFDELKRLAPAKR
jgi:hypothetical protein